jgi:hypothetical protein
VQGHVLGDVAHVVGLEGLKVGAEEPRIGHVLFGLSIHAGVNRVVGPLKQAKLAIVADLEAGVPVVLLRQAEELVARHDHRSGDVVLHLHFVGRQKILAQLVRPPSAARIEAHAQIASDQLAPVVFELVAVHAVDHVDAEMVAPIVAPLLAVEALDDEHDRAHVVRNGFEPRVVLGRKIGRVRREQLDHRAE